MILQNISKAIREQNYYAVALEFVIVIAGVVIGFQINAWNEGRAEQARTSMLLDRIEEEFRTIESDLFEYEQLLASYETASKNVIAAIREETVATTDPEVMRVWLGEVRHVGRPPARSAIFAEMIASGEFSLLPVELRAALSEFDQEIQRNTYLWPEAATHLTSAKPLFDAVEYNALFEGARVNAFDPDLLPLAESDLEALVIYQGALRFTYAQLLQSARDILASLEANEATDLRRDP